MSNVMSLPGSLVALQCADCQGFTKRILVCYCGEDVCHDCLVTHQTHCGYAIEGRFKDTEKKKRKSKG